MAPMTKLHMDAVLTCEILLWNVPDRVAPGIMDAGGPVCTLVTLAVVCAHVTLDTCVPRLTPAVVGCSSVRAVAMGTGVWKAFVNAEFAVCP